MNVILGVLVRAVVHYSELEKQIQISRLKELNSQINTNKLLGISKIYMAQSNIAMTVQADFGHMPRTLLNILVIAKTQSGKTGAMIAICRDYKKYHNIPIGNIYMITGHSSKAWKKQTKKRFPAVLEKNIYHRPDFGKKNGPKNKLIKEISQKKNILFIMDEVHVAAKKGQSMDSLFKKLGFNNRENCLKKDIKIVEFSATPDGTVYDINGWGRNSKIIKMEPGHNYVGADDLEQQKRVSQFQDLCCYNKNTGQYNRRKAIKNIEEIKSKITKYDEPMYHIIRTPVAPHQNEVIDMFKEVFPNEYKYETFDGDSKKSVDMTSINDRYLKIKPKKHTFIFIKEMLRMAVTLHKEYLGILYERRSKNINDSTMIQGLIGRATGYDDNGKTHIFTNIDSIIKYRNLWDSDFSTELMIQWKSNTTKSSVGGGTESRGTFNVPAGGESKTNNDDKQESYKLHYRIFDSYEKAIDYGKNLRYENGKTPRFCRKKKRVTNNNGCVFICDSLTENTKKSQVPRSLDDVEHRMKKCIHRNNKQTSNKSNTTMLVYYENPPEKVEEEWVNGDDKTERYVVPIPYIRNDERDDGLPKYVEDIDKKYNIGPDKQYSIMSKREKE